MAVTSPCCADARSVHALEAEAGAASAATPLPLHGCSMLGRPMSADVTAMSMDDEAHSQSGSSSGSTG
jgi:hypothetical protein